MTQNEILENNKLIAEFLIPNWKLLKDSNYKGGIENKDLFTVACLCSKDYHILKYHKSWDKLMLVVAKCTEIGYSGNIDFEDKLYLKWEELFGDNLSSAFLGNHIEEVYFTVIDFINYYNKEKEHVT